MIAPACRRSQQYEDNQNKMSQKSWTHKQFCPTYLKDESTIYRDVSITYSSRNSDSPVHSLNTKFSPPNMHVYTGQRDRLRFTPHTHPLRSPCPLTCDLRHAAVRRGQVEADDLLGDRFAHLAERVQRRGGDVRLAPPVSRLHLLFVLQPSANHMSVRASSIYVS